MSAPTGAPCAKKKYSVLRHTTPTYIDCCVSSSAIFSFEYENRVNCWRLDLASRACSGDIGSAVAVLPDGRGIARHAYLDGNVEYDELRMSQRNGLAHLLGGLSWAQW